jgi:hypothetical protein
MLKYHQPCIWFAKTAMPESLALEGRVEAKHPTNASFLSTVATISGRLTKRLGCLCHMRALLIGVHERRFALP